MPAAPINGYADILENDPHVTEMGLVRPLTLPNGVETRTTAFPVRMSGFEFQIRRGPPRLGEHTRDVFAEWLSEE